MNMKKYTVVVYKHGDSPDGLNDGWTELPGNYIRIDAAISECLYIIRKSKCYHGVRIETDGVIVRGTQCRW